MDYVNVIRAMKFDCFDIEEMQEQVRRYHSEMVCMPS
jgi:hypothetical protein